MFKVPAWGNDIPKTNVKFGKKVNAKKTRPGEHSPNRAQALARAKRVKKKVPVKTKKLNEVQLISTNPTENPITKISSMRGVRNIETARRLSNIGNNLVNAVELLNKTKKSKIYPGSQSMVNKDLQKTKSEKITQCGSIINITSETNSCPNKPSLKRGASNINTDKKQKLNKECKDDKSIGLNYLSIGEDIGKSNYKKKKEDKMNPNKVADDVAKATEKKLEEKKEKIKQLLDNNKSTTSIKENQLRDRMMDRLKAAQFRYLNEKLYTITGDQAQKLFQADPKAFQTYHQGYQLQVKKWPINPLDVIIRKIEKLPKNLVIADMGCGEAALSRRVPHTVHSFDLVASAPGVVACDMAHTPLADGSVDIAVYCLALMGTELTQCLIEANRILKVGGQLLIAEVESRFEDINTFTRGVEKLGFKLKNFDQERSVFFFMHFEKTGDPPHKKHKLPALQLKPCLYKRR